MTLHTSWHGQFDEIKSAGKDCLGRRSRFKRQVSDKRIHLNERDIDVLRWLYRYRYLRTSHLTQIFKPRSPKRFVERLGDLFHETGYINRPNLLGDRFSAHATSMLYEISNKGIELLEVQGVLPDRAVTFSRRSPRSYSPQHLHTMMIIEALLEIELETTTNINQRFVSVDEILARAPECARLARNPLRIPVTLKPCTEHPIIRSRQETHLIPDALYGIEYLIDGEKRYRFWALECERTSPGSRANASASSTALKRAAYDALIKSRAYKSYWGIPNLKLHLVTTTMEQTGR